jgi:hypothetical protein
VFAGIFQAKDLPVFRAAGREMTRFQGGERGRAGQQARECDVWKLLSVGCRGRLLVRCEDVCLMTGHTRLAFQEWIRLQLCHLIGVTGVACA